MLCPAIAIANPASCEMRAVIRFLQAKNMNVAEIHGEFCAAYYQNIISEGPLWHWCKMLKDGRANKCSGCRAKWWAICSE
jgi:hypothetical protein